MSLRKKYEKNWGRLGMRSDWKYETIADVCEVVTDGSHYSPKKCTEREIHGFGKRFY